MIDTKIFDKENIDFLRTQVKKILEKCNDFSSKRLLASPRSVGDTVQEIIAENIAECFPDNLVKDIGNDFARRAMADVAFYDNNGNYFIVDIKTHNKSTSFNMPNLTSVERLSKFYESDKNFFVILFVEYDVKESGISFDKIEFVPIEHASWQCLTIGALGWGQIQIANANNFIIDNTLLRKDWMLSLCDMLDEFYPKEISKIQIRMDRFSKVRKFWESK